MISQTPHRSLLASLLLLGIVVAAPGCSALNPGVAPLFAEGQEAESGPVFLPERPETPSVVVEWHPTEDQPTRAWMALKDGMYAQDVLDASGTMKKFRRVNLEILRKNPTGPGRHRMTLTYDRSERRITDATNYSLRPDDRVRIMEDSATMFNDMMDTVTKPLAPIFRTRS